MLIIKGEEHNPRKLLEHFDVPLTAYKNGELINTNTEKGYINTVFYNLFEDLFIHVTELETKESIYFRNKESDKQRVVLQIMQEGLTSSLEGNKINSKNEILIYNTNQKLDLVFTANKRIKWITISFSSELFEVMASEKDFALKELIQDKKPWFTYFNITPDIESVIQAIFQIRDNEELRRAIFLSKAIEILGLLRIKLDQIKFGVSTNKTTAEIDKMIEFKNNLLSNYAFNPNIKELCEQMNMSESSLQRAFKELFNMPIIKFFNQNRLEEAHRQIKYSARSITEISMDLGFTHIHHLSSAFKKQFGYSPKSLRKHL